MSSCYFDLTRLHNTHPVFIRQASSLCSTFSIFEYKLFCFVSTICKVPLLPIELCLFVRTMYCSDITIFCYTKPYFCTKQYFYTKNYISEQKHISALLLHSQSSNITDDVQLVTPPAPYSFHTVCTVLEVSSTSLSAAFLQGFFVCTIVLSFKVGFSFTPTLNPKKASRLLKSKINFWLVRLSEFFFVKCRHLYMFH